jgi:hypothetical protein
MVNNDTKKAVCQKKNANLDRALGYRRMGLAVIPMREKGQEKKPYVRWGKLREKLPTFQDIRTLKQNTINPEEVTHGK